MVNGKWPSLGRLSKNSANLNTKILYMQTAIYFYTVFKVEFEPT